jgi:sn-glycerol 3-phosphate transport system ATP-binding protein
VQAGLRPEDITLGTDGLPGRVESVEYFGADSILSVDIGGPRVAVRLQGRPAFGPDDTVNLGWPADALHLFDATTGMRRETTAPHLTSTETQTA